LRLETKNGLEKLVRIENLRGDLSVNVLAESSRLIDALHLSQDFFVEEGWDENVSWVLLDICLISGIPITELLSLRRLPLLRGDQASVEDFFGVDLN
jgi:hypothetical protein